jgi:hypothetical protein
VTLILLTVSALTVVVLAVLTSVRRNLRPLSALGAAADRVGRQQYDVPLHVVTGDEFETFAGGFIQFGIRSGSASRRINHRLTSRDFLNFSSATSVAPRETKCESRSCLPPTVTSRSNGS